MHTDCGLKSVASVTVSVVLVVSGTKACQGCKPHVKKENCIWHVIEVRSAVFAGVKA